MGNLTSALQQLREERKVAQSHVEKLDTAISVIESLNGSETLGKSHVTGHRIAVILRPRVGETSRGLRHHAQRSLLESAVGELNLHGCVSQPLPESQRSSPTQDCNLSFPELYFREVWATVGK